MNRHDCEWAYMFLFYILHSFNINVLILASRLDMLVISFELYLHLGARKGRGRARHVQPHQRLRLSRVLSQDERWRERGLWNGHQGRAASQETGQKKWLSAVIETCRRVDVSQQPRRLQSREPSIHVLVQSSAVSDWYWDIMSDKPRETNGNTSGTRWCHFLSSLSLGLRVFWSHQANKIEIGFLKGLYNYDIWCYSSPSTLLSPKQNGCLISVLSSATVLYIGQIVCMFVYVRIWMFVSNECTSVSRLPCLHCICVYLPGFILFEYSVLN